MGKVRRARRAAAAAAETEEEGAESSPVIVVIVDAVVVVVAVAIAAANRGLALPPSTISSSIFSCSRAAGVKSCVCAIGVRWVGAGREEKERWGRGSNRNY